MPDTCLPPIPWIDDPGAFESLDRRRLDLDTRHEYHTVAGRSHVVLKQPFFQKSYI